MNSDFIYLSDIDLTQGRGPSVNELEFVDALHSVLGKRLKIYTVGAVKGNPRLATMPLTSILGWSGIRSNPVKLVVFEIAAFFVILTSLILKPHARFFLRISIFPLALMILAPFASGRFHLKTVGDGSFRYLNKFPLGATLIRINVGMYKWIMRYAHGADFVTAAHLDSFAAKVGHRTKLHVVDNCVNTDVFFLRDKAVSRRELGLEGYAYVYGYVGNDPLHRGAAESVMVLPEVRRTLNAAVLIVGMSRDEALRVYDESTLRHVVFAGHVSYPEVPLLMSALDVGVSFLPEWHRGASEQKVRQYLASGVVPVVTPGGSEFIQAAGVGFVVENSVVSEIAESLKTALKASSSMREKCRAYAIAHLSHIELARKRLEIFN